jgi:hypothetical protein
MGKFSVADFTLKIVDINTLRSKLEWLQGTEFKCFVDRREYAYDQQETYFDRRGKTSVVVGLNVKYKYILERTDRLISFNKTKTT